VLRTAVLKTAVPRIAVLKTPAPMTAVPAEADVLRTTVAAW
jgi:hypothetical protein